MPNRENWGGRGRHGQHDRWRPDNERHRREHDRPWEHRSFGQEGRFSSDEARYGPGSRGRRYDLGEPPHGEGRHAAPFDPDRGGYGDLEYGYGGEEYGLEGGPAHQRRDPFRGGGREERETWGPDVGEPYGDLELNPRNRGIQEFGPPHDYAYHPQAGHEFDPDYLRWREEQLRGHDRDYREWRRAQQDSYDEDYRRFRSERREHFGRSFQEWRAQRGGEQATAQGGQPSGAQADMSPEFGKTPPQVQAASEGGDSRGEATERKRER